MTLTQPRVALFVTEFLKYSQTFIYDEIRHHERYRVEVISHRRVNRDQFPFDRVHHLTPGRGLLGEAEALLYKTTALSPGFHRLLAKDRPDLLHAHFGPGSLYALPYKFGLRLPLVVTYHGYDVPLLLSRARFRPANWRYWLMSRFMLRAVDRFLAASNELAELLAELGAPRDRIHVWRLGVEIPEEIPSRMAKSKTGPNDEVTILMVGRFVEKKGFEYGLEAFSDVLAQGTNARLKLIGEGPRLARYQEIIRRRRIGDRVELLGVLPHDAVLSEMERCDILLAPSVVAEDGDRESGLIVVKEANARSVPAIGTLHGGIPEIIEQGRTGFLVPERDPSAISRHLVQLIHQPGLRMDLGREAREKMRREYEIGDRVRILEQHYDEVIRNFYGSLDS